MAFISIVLVLLSLLMQIYFVIKGPFIGFLNIFLIVYIYLLRPLAIMTLKGSILYRIDFDYFNYAFFYASLSLFCGKVGYMMTFPRLSKIRKKSKTVKLFTTAKKSERIIRESILLSLIFLSIMFAIAGKNFLGVYRNAAVSAIYPVFRYIYPIVQVNAAIIAFYGVLTLNKNKTKGILLLSISLILTAIIYQRGMTVGAITVAFSLIIDNIRLKMSRKNSNIFRNVILLFLLFLVVVFIRDILSFGFKSIKLFEVSTNNNFYDTLITAIVIRPDGDKIEVWCILIEYIKNKGLLLGKTLLNIPFTLSSSYFRLKSGFKTGLDILNEYYDFETYWFRKFGFNLDSSQELVMNFGVVGIFYSFIIGLLEGIVIKKFYYNIIKGKEIIQQYLFFYGFSAFLGSFSSFHWMLFALFLSFIYRVLSRFKLFKSMTIKEGFIWNNLFHV